MVGNLCGRISWTDQCIRFSMEWDKSYIQHSGTLLNCHRKYFDCSLYVDFKMLAKHFLPKISTNSKSDTSSVEEVLFFWWGISSVLSINAHPLCIHGTMYKHINCWPNENIVENEKFVQYYTKIQTYRVQIQFEYDNVNKAHSTHLFIV